MAQLWLGSQDRYRVLKFLINKQSGILSKLTPCSVLAAVGTVGSWQPGIKSSTCNRRRGGSESAWDQNCPVKSSTELRDFQGAIKPSCSVPRAWAWTQTVSSCPKCQQWLVGDRCKDTCLNSGNGSDRRSNKQRKHSTVKVGPAGCSFPGISVVEPVGKFTECLIT